METEPTVFVVDDDRGARDSVVALAAAASLRVRTFGTAEEFLEAFQEETAGCLVLNAKLPDMKGIDLLTHLRNKGAQIPVILLTACANIDLAIRSMKIGAFEFLQKPYVPEEMTNCLIKAIDWDAELRSRQAKYAVVGDRLATLTPREREVLDRLLEGKQSKQIAAELGTSTHTVQNQRSSILRKMGAASIVDLVRIVTEFRSRRHDTFFPSSNA